MGTPFTDVFDLFLTKVQDYRLNTLYNTSPNDLTIYLQGFLINALPLFYNCNQSLAKNNTTQLFTADLAEENQVMIADLMVEKWLGKELLNVTQMNLTVQDRDFKSHSADKNMEGKAKRLIEKREQNAQALVDYGYKYNNWSDWFNGTFVV